MICMTLQQNNRQKGMALIVAIGFMAILSILGAVVLRNATRDLGMSGSFMPARDAFYTSDRAVEYAMNRDIIVNLTPGETVVLAGDIDGNGTDDAEYAMDENASMIVPNILHETIIEAGTNNDLVAGTVTDLGPHDLPPSMSAIHGSDFGANLYHVEVESNSPTGMTSRVNASIVRLYKMDDDTIFRSDASGGISGSMLSH